MIKIDEKVLIGIVIISAVLSAFAGANYADYVTYNLAVDVYESLAEMEPENAATYQYVANVMKTEATSCLQKTLLFGAGAIIIGVGGIAWTIKKQEEVQEKAEKVPAKAEKAPAKLKSTQIKRMVYEYLVKQGGEINIKECARELGIPESNVEMAIEVLKANGKLGELEAEEEIERPKIKKKAKK